MVGGVMAPLVRLAAGLALASVCLVTAAESLRDPTRPADAAGSKRTSAKPASRNALTLQTVVISPQRRTAVISGRVMVPGDRISGYTLTAIHEAEVVMTGPKGTRTLQLYPAVKKVASTTGPADETKGPK